MATESKGLPQLDPESFEPQLVWLVITFAALYFLLSRFLLPRIANILTERQGRIDRDLREAVRLKSETEAALKAYEQALAEAKGKAQVIAQQTRDRLKAETDAERTRTEKAIADKAAAAESRIATAKSGALGQVDAIATETAEAIVGALVGLDVGREEIARAVAAARGR